MPHVHRQLNIIQNIQIPPASRFIWYNQHWRNAPGMRIPKCCQKYQKNINGVKWTMRVAVMGSFKSWNWGYRWAAWGFLPDLRWISGSFYRLFEKDLAKR